MRAQLAERDLALMLAHTAALWEDVRGRRILLTGGTGFFGHWLVESFCHANRLLKLGAHMTVLTRDLAGAGGLAASGAVDLVGGDVCDFTFPPGEYRYVVHAAPAPVERVLEFAAAHGTEALLVTSSGAVYGAQRVTHVTEDTTLEPTTTYGAEKMAAELACVGSRVPVKVARCWAFCGPYLPMNRNFAIGNFIADVLAGRPIAVKGDGTPRRSYLYAADLVVWLWTILLKAPPMVPVNVGSNCDVTILQLAETVATVLNHHAGIRVAEEAVAGARAESYVPSVSRALKLLGLRQTVGLAESIQRTAEWARGRV